MTNDKPSDGPEYLYGLNTILSLLQVNAGNRKIKRLIASRDLNKTHRVKEIESIATKREINIDIVEQNTIKELLSDFSDDVSLSLSQSIIAEVGTYNYSDLGHFINKNYDDISVILMLDGVTDMGNFGSILRNCSAFAASGVIISKHRSVSVNSRLSKLSSGALEEVKIFLEKNLNRTISILKDRGFWIYGSTLKKEKANTLEEAGCTKPMVLILGNEQKGLSRLVEKNCDFLVSIPQKGRMQSLNVSVASGIFLYNIQKELLGKS